MSEAHRAAAWYVTYVLVIAAAANSGYSTEAELNGLRVRLDSVAQQLERSRLKAPQDSPSSVLVQTPLKEASLTSGEAG